MAESESKEKAMGKDNPTEEKKEKTPPKKARKSEIIRNTGGAGDKINSTMRGEVKHVTNGVTFANGKKGSYIWYKTPGEGATERDRDEVYEENMPEVNQRPEMRRYYANKNK